MPLIEAGEGLAPKRAGLQAIYEAVWILTSLIPPGRVTTYGTIARTLGVPPRLVGRALAENPNPIIVPCHRVVRSDGSLGGYSRGGPRVKAQLLRLEGVPVTPELRVPQEYIIRSLPPGIDS